MRNYAESKQRLADRWPENRVEDFKTREARNEHLSAWAEVRFGPTRKRRPLELAGASFLFAALDFLPRIQLESLFHSGLIDGELGVVKNPQWWRWPFAGLAVLYLPLALFGAGAFSILVFVTTLDPLLKAFLVVTISAGLLGHAMHAFLILVMPLWVARKCRRRRIVERIRGLDA